MALKIVIIGLFLTVFTFGMAIWVNSIQIPSPKMATKPTQSDQADTFVSPDSTMAPAVLSASTSSKSASESACLNRCGDDVCQYVTCKGASCTCPENDVSCPQDCK